MIILDCAIHSSTRVRFPVGPYSIITVYHPLLQVIHLNFPSGKAKLKESQEMRCFETKYSSEQRLTIRIFCPAVKKITRSKPTIDGDSYVYLQGLCIVLQYGRYVDLGSNTSHKEVSVNKTTVEPDYVVCQTLERTMLDVTYFEVGL